MANESDNCTICLESVHNSGQSLFTTSCGHIFHNKCIKTYVAQYHNKECPNCRKVVDDFDDVVIPTNINPPTENDDSLSHDAIDQLIQNEQQNNSHNHVIHITPNYQSHLYDQINRRVDIDRSYNKDIIIQALLQKPSPNIIYYL